MRDVQEEDFVLGDVLCLRKKEVHFGTEMAPSVILYDPRYIHNIGCVIRSLSCFGGKAVLFTGERILSLLKDPTLGKRGKRFPREERMKGYQDIRIIHDDYPLTRFSSKVVPVAVEVRDHAEELPNFVHPQNAVYIFGPEDGSLSQTILRLCQRFVVIPSRYCLNLGHAVSIVLYDRIVKLGITRSDFIIS